MANSKTFSLIELLIALAIILIVAAIAIPNRPRSWRGPDLSAEAEISFGR